MAVPLPASPAPPPSPFDEAPSPEAHFRVHFFAAVAELASFVASLEAPGFEDRHPFLAEYRREAEAVLPSHAEGGWALAVARWEASARGGLPLRAMGRALGLTVRQRLPFLLAGLVEEDFRFGTLFADLQAPLRARRPTQELVGRVLAAGEDGPAVGLAQATEAFVESGFLTAENPEAPRAERALGVPEALWGALRGERLDAAGLAIHEAAAFPPVAELVASADLLRRLARVVPLVQVGHAKTVVVRGPEGADRLAVAGAVARAVGRGVVAVDGGRPTDLGVPIGPLCTFLGAMPVVRFDLGPGETATLPVLQGYAGPVGVLMGTEGGLADAARALAITLPAPDAAERRRHWAAALGLLAGPDLDAIAERYRMPGGHIRRVAEAARAEAALAGRDAVTLGDVQAARRQLGRELLDTLADPLDAGAITGDPWGYLVAGEAVRDRLRELERRCRHRERLLGHLGPAFGTGTGTGVRALLKGPSGTGKTLAARLLAARLGMDLYRVDLAAVVNKYIGETEKNLHRVLSVAEDLDVLLLLDEGDALLGSRTDVKTANDRYANLETNYLLQRLEHYGGVVLVTTNLGENVDKAFQRRMDLVVDFLPPRPDERRRLWALHLPERHAVGDRFLGLVSGQCALTGGQIRNAAHLATLLALDAGRPVADGHLDAALRSEYRKAGATYPLDGAPAAGDRSRQSLAFLDALPR